jgi:NADH-quinone oxidoreductase subunit M
VIVRVLLALMVLLFSPLARADGTASFVEEGPVMLDAAGQGQITLRNSGNAPLHVVTIYARSNERDPRVPGTLTASFDGGNTKADLAAGESKAIRLKWDGRGARMTQLFGHVVVETSDGAAPQRAMGVIGRPPSALGFLSNHVATWLILLPLLGALAIVPLARRRDDRLARYVALGAVALQGAFAVWAVRNFDALITRSDGNDGLQMVERARLFGGVEWYLGFDGLSLPLVVTLIGLAVLGVFASFRLERGQERFFVGYLCAVSMATGALLAVDAMLLVTFVSLFAIASLVAAGRRRGTMHMFIMQGLGAIALLVVVLVLRRHSDATFLVDGTRAQTFAIPELARGEWLERTHAGLTLFGKPFVKAAFVVIFFAGGIFLSAAPLHGGLANSFDDAPTGAAILGSCAAAAIGTTILLRLGVTVVPEGARWAAPALAAIGAAGIAWGALSAMGEGDLRRVAAHVGVAHAGVILFALAAGTPQGVAGAIGHTIARAVIVAALLLIAGVLHDRVGVTTLSRFGGLLREIPVFGVLASIVFAGAFAMPGTLPFVSAMLSITSGLPGHRVTTVIAAAGLVLLAIAVILAHRRVLLGDVDERWRSAAELEPFGGRFPDLDRREASLLLAIAVAIALLGISPRWLVELSRGAIVDLDARVNAERIG